LYDSERELTGADKPVVSDLRVQAWILALLAAIGVLGFVLGIFAYITLFLRLKGGVKWSGAMLGALGAIAVLSTLGYYLVLEYPRGLLQYLFDLPWPLN
jgi:hypothetical protein